MAIFLILLIALSIYHSVPLANDDDWDWDESGGDVELASRAHHQEEEDLRMAMALSLSESPEVPRPKAVGSATRRANSGGRSSTAAADGKLFIHLCVLFIRSFFVCVSHWCTFHVDWDDWGDDDTPAVTSTRVAPAPVSAPAPALAGTRQKNAARRKPPPPKPKPQQDDIFASIGLSAKPTFAPSAKPTQSKAPTSSSLAAAAEDMDVEADWGDDSDLDDLLDD